MMPQGGSREAFVGGMLVTDCAKGMREEGGEEGGTAQGQEGEGGVPGGRSEGRMLVMPDPHVQE